MAVGELGVVVAGGISPCALPLPMLSETGCAKAAPANRNPAQRTARGGNPVENIVMAVLNRSEDERRKRNTDGLNYN